MYEPNCSKICLNCLIVVCVQDETLCLSNASLIIIGITQGNNSKRVSFGSTTTRLIPPSTSATETQSGLKKYPKLTMTINNRSKGKINPLSRPIGKTAAGNAKRKIIDRLGSNRVPVKRSNEVLSMNSTGKKMCSILDRLG